MGWWGCPAETATRSAATTGWATPRDKLHGRWDRASTGRGDGAAIHARYGGQRTSGEPRPASPASVSAFFAELRTSQNHCGEVLAVWPVLLAGRRCAAGAVQRIAQHVLDLRGLRGQVLFTIRLD